MLLALLFSMTVHAEVPQEVMDAYYRDGGRITYHDTLYLEDVPCWGIYYWKDKSIRIRKDAPESTLSHEIGHWLYHRQVWSGELQDMAGRAFSDSPLQTCTDENFAIGYAMHCTGKLGGELEEFYTVIEDGTCRSF